jgi:hypothetical protein
VADLIGLKAHRAVALHQRVERPDTLWAGMFKRTTMILTVIALGMAPAPAIATSRDLAATHAYIRANYAFARASEARVAPAQANIDALNQKLGRECPKVGAGSLQNEASQPMSYEVVVALWSSSYGTDAGPIRTFVDTVRRLRWSNSRLTHIAQSYARSLHELAALPMPDLCGDVSTWKASGFKTVPASTILLDRRVEAIEGKTIPASLLAPYEQPGDRGILASTMSLETKLQQTETVVGFNDWDLLLETLGLNQ